MAPHTPQPTSSSSSFVEHSPHPTAVGDASTRRGDPREEGEEEKRPFLPENSQEMKEEEEGRRERRGAERGEEEERGGRQGRLSERVLEKLHVLPVYEAKAEDEQVFKTLQSLMNQHVLFRQHMSFEVPGPSPPPSSSSLPSPSGRRNEGEENRKETKATAAGVPSSSSSSSSSSAVSCRYIVVECVPHSGYLGANTLVFLRGQPLKALARVQVLALIHPNSSYARRAGINSYQHLFNQSVNFPAVDRVNPLISFASSSSSSSSSSPSSLSYMISPFTPDADVAAPRRRRAEEEEEEEQRAEGLVGGGGEGGSDGDGRQAGELQERGERQRRREEEEEDDGFLTHLENLQERASEARGGGSLFTRRGEGERTTAGRLPFHSQHQPFSLLADFFFSTRGERRRRGRRKKRQHDRRPREGEEGEVEREDSSRGSGRGGQSDRLQADSCPGSTSSLTSSVGTSTEREDEEEEEEREEAEEREERGGSSGGGSGAFGTRVDVPVSSSVSSSSSSAACNPSTLPKRRVSRFFSPSSSSSSAPTAVGVASSSSSRHQEEEDKDEREEEREESLDRGSQPPPPPPLPTLPPRLSSSSRSTSTSPAIPEERSDASVTRGAEERERERRRSERNEASRSRSPRCRDTHLARRSHTTPVSRHGYTDEALLFVKKKTLKPLRRRRTTGEDRGRENGLKEISPESLFRAYIGPYLLARMYSSTRRDPPSSSSSSPDQGDSTDHTGGEEEEGEQAEESRKKKPEKAGSPEGEKGQETKKKRKKKKKKRKEESSSRKERRRRSDASSSSKSVIVLYPGKKLVVGNLTFVVWATDPPSLPGFVDENTCIYISLDPYGEFSRVHFVPFTDTLPTTYFFDFYEDYLKPFLLENEWRIFRRGDVYTYRGVEFKLIASEPESCLYARVGPETIVHHQGSVLPTILDILPREVLARIRRLPTRLQPYAIIAAAQRVDPQALLRVIPSSALHPASHRGINDRVVDMLQDNLVRPFSFKYYRDNFPEMCEKKRSSREQPAPPPSSSSSPSSSADAPAVPSLEEEKTAAGDEHAAPPCSSASSAVDATARDSVREGSGGDGSKPARREAAEAEEEEGSVEDEEKEKGAERKSVGRRRESREEKDVKRGDSTEGDRKRREAKGLKEEEEEEDVCLFERPSCTVCTLQIEERDLSIILPCGHVFHWQCVHAWLRRNSTCPNCRADINALVSSQRPHQQSDERSRPTARTGRELEGGGGE